MSTRRRFIVSVPLVAYVATIDHVLNDGSHRLAVAGLLDESAHLCTGLLVLWALPLARSRALTLSVLAGSVLIDVDHIPAQIFDRNWLTGGTPRPYSHSMVTLIVLALSALILRRSGRHRAALVAGGALAGVSFHFLRDLAVPRLSGVSLLWPFTDRAMNLPEGAYLGVLGALVLLAAGQDALRTRRGPRSRSGLITRRPSARPAAVSRSS